MDSSNKIAAAGLVNMLNEINNPITNIKLCLELLQNCSEDARETYYSILKRSVEIIEMSLKDISNAFVNEDYRVMIDSRDEFFHAGL